MTLTVPQVLGDPAAVRRAVVLCGVLCGLQVSDPVIASLALPRAGQELGFTASQLALAASIATLCLAGTVVLMGALADRFGRRRVTLLLTAGLALADLMVLAVATTPAYLVGRALAGVCAGGLVATTLAYVRTVSPPERIGADLGIWGALSFAVAVPMSVLGAALASVDWRLAFACVPVAAVATIPLQRVWLPWVGPRSETPQLWGVVVAGLGLVAILLGVGQMASSVSAIAWLLPIAVGCLLLATAAVIGLRSKRPAFPVPIFRSPVFAVAALSGVLWNLASGVAQLQSSNLWQYAEGASPMTAALLQLPLNVAVVASSVAAGRRLAAGGAAGRIIPGGFLVVALGFAGMSLCGGAALSAAFTAALMVVGLGAGWAAVAQSRILLGEAPARFLGPVAASRTTFGQLGYALGLAGGTVITTLLTVHEMGTPGARADLNVFLTTDRADAAADPALGAVTARVAPFFVDAFRAGMWVWVGVFVAGAVACFAMMHLRHRPLPGAGEDR